MKIFGYYNYRPSKGVCWGKGSTIATADPGQGLLTCRNTIQLLRKHDSGHCIFWVKTLGLQAPKPIKASQATRTHTKRAGPRS